MLNRVKKNARAIAAEVVGRWAQNGEFPERLIESVADNRAFIMEVVYGTLRQKRALEWVVDRCTERRPDKRVMPYLLTGLYQILMLSTVTDYAAVNETVEAVKRGPAGVWAAGLVNGVLRRVLREKEALLAELRRQPVGIRESHPDVLVERWIARYGNAKTDELCRWNNSRPQVTLCPNLLQTTAAGLLQKLRTAGIEAAVHPADPACLVIPHGVAVPDLPGYAEGWFTVQDPSTLAAVRLLNARPGEEVLDACAAPGGKTALIAAAMKDQGVLMAADMREDRLDRIRENAERLRLQCVKVLQADASQPGLAAAVGERRFDRILLDVPCTNTGVLRRRPDARWRFSAERMDELGALQRAILDHASRLLKPGGTLVYSTCSIEPEEGPLMVDGWLRSNAAFRRCDMIALCPPQSGTDGVFAASVTTS